MRQADLSRLTGGVAAISQQCHDCLLTNSIMGRATGIKPAGIGVAGRGSRAVSGWIVLDVARKASPFCGRSRTSRKVTTAPNGKMLGINGDAITSDRDLCKAKVPINGSRRFARRILIPPHAIKRKPHNIADKHRAQNLHGVNLRVHYVHKGIGRDQKAEKRCAEAQRGGPFQPRREA